MKKIAEKLGRISTLYYVLLYLVLILVFSVVYYYMPERSFYHTTSQFEYSEFNSEADEITKDLKNSIVNNNLEVFHDSIINLENWKININQIIVNSFNVAGFPKDVSFVLHLVIQHSNGIRTFLSPIIKINIQEKIVTQNLVFCSLNTDYKCASVIDSITTPDIKSLFQVSSKDGFQSLTPSLILPSELWNKIIFFGQGYRGFPNKEIRGQWFRMVYLSSGIATSTLIGDIVPITKLSRSLITLQGLLMIIVISLFFNALAFDISQGLDKSKKKKERK